MPALPVPAPANRVCLSKRIHELRHHIAHLGAELARTCDVLHDAEWQLHDAMSQLTAIPCHEPDDVDPHVVVEHAA